MSKPHFFFTTRSVTLNERVDSVIDWISRPTDQRPQFMTLYYDEPDHTGHAKGPTDTPEVRKHKFRCIIFLSLFLFPIYSFLLDPTSYVGRVFSLCVGVSVCLCFQRFLSDDIDLRW